MLQWLGDDQPVENRIATVKAYELQRRKGITIIRLRSKPDLSVLEQIIEELEEQQVSFRLWDVSVGVRLTSEELRLLAGRKANFVPSKTAVLSTNDDLAFGLARMYEAHSGLEESFCVFRVEEEALSWLAKPF